MAYDPDSAIERGGMVPPYRQLAGILTARIERGDWQPGRRMASETDLQQVYGLSRKTIRKAISVLEDDVPGRGGASARHVRPACGVTEKHGGVRRLLFGDAAPGSAPTRGR